MYKKYNQEEKIDHVKEITDKLEAGIKDIFDNPKKENRFDDEKFKNYLKAISNFHNYSYNNCLLIGMQKPDATLVAGYKKWETDYGRHVKKGEKGIKILAPNPYTIKAERDKIDPKTNQPILDENGNKIKELVDVKMQSFRTVSVFDVSQTEGKELPRALAHGTKELEGEVDGYDKFMEALKQVSPVDIEYKTLYNGSKGYFSSAEQKIVINTDMSQLQNVKTAVHEVAHAFLHDHNTGSEKDKDLSRGEKEVQAESVAFTVCQHYGIDTSDYSFSYVANWSSGKEMNELKASLDTIRKTASDLITSLDEKMQEMEHSMERSENQVQQTKIELSQDIAKNHPEMEYSR